MNYTKALSLASIMIICTSSSFAQTQTFSCEFQLYSRITQGSSGMHPTFHQQPFSAIERYYIEINFEKKRALKVGYNETFNCEILNERERFEKLVCRSEYNTVDDLNFASSRKSRETHRMFQIIKASGEFLHINKFLWNSKEGELPNFNEPRTYLQEDAYVGTCSKKTPQPLW